MDVNKKAEIVRAQFGGRDPLFGTGAKLPKLVELRLETIRLNPDQPRKTFDEASLKELASSIEQHGLLQPITVKRIPDEDEYLLAAGERRYRATQKLGRPTIAAIITDGNADELAVIENLQREDLRPLEQAEALARLMDSHGYTQEQLARVIGKARSTVTELLQITTLPDPIKEECRTSDIPKSVLVEIVRAKEPEARLALWERLKGGGTVKAARATKKSGEIQGAQSFTTTTKALAAAKGLLRRLQELAPGELTANHDQYQELVRIKAEIDELMAQKAKGAEA
jgi:ParB family transcriptional regulator, chromosome partitioning protein